VEMFVDYFVGGLEAEFDERFHCFSVLLLLRKFCVC